jgi:two-component system LytT family sensor kinase
VASVILVIPVLLLSVLLESFNSGFGWWQRGLCFNTAFLALFVLYLLWTVRGVPRAYQAQRRAVEQEKELMQSRISIMRSQIQSHFLYNALTAIARLCDIDPAKAKKTTLDFSEYLRGNLDSLSRTRPVLVSTPAHADLRGDRADPLWGQAEDGVRH